MKKLIIVIASLLIVSWMASARMSFTTNSEVFRFNGAFSSEGVGIRLANGLGSGYISQIQALGPDDQT